MVVTDTFPFATVTEGCKDLNFIEFSNKFTTLYETSKVMNSRMTYSWKNPMKITSLQPSVTIVKGKMSFATVTHGCRAVTFMNIG